MSGELFLHDAAATEALGRSLAPVLRAGDVVLLSGGLGMGKTSFARGVLGALGLGLPLAKQFIEAHGGSVSLVSETGQGSLVTVELPRR